MKTLNDLLAQTGSYFRSLCKVYNAAGIECADMPAGVQFYIHRCDNVFSFPPLLCKRGLSEDPGLWLTFEEAATILKAYAQAWERSNPQGVWQEEAVGNSVEYGGLEAKWWPKFFAVNNGSSGIVFEGEGGEYEARTALFNHLSGKGGGK